MVVGGGEGREYQGHSHQVWSGQVCSVCMHKYTTARGVWGHTPPPPRKFLQFMGYEIVYETIFGSIR